MSRDRLFLWLFILVGFAVGVFGVWKYAGFFTDDSFISLRYCQNALDGNGLVWNSGERVEGYSNFFLVILVSALGASGVDLVLISKGVGVISFVVLLGYLLWRFKARDISEGDNRLASLLPVLIAGTSYCMIIWSFGGLETILFCLLVTVGVLTALDGLKSHPRTTTCAGFILGLAALTRPDGGLFFAIAAVFYLIALIKRQSLSGQRFLALVMPFIILVGAHEVWRYVYYGQFLPNTWYVKGGFTWEKFDMGWRYLVGFVMTQPMLLPPLALSLIYRAVIRTWNLPLSFLSISIFSYVIYVAALGGDHMLAYRPLVAVIPLISVLIASAFLPLIHAVRARVAVAFFILLAIAQIVYPGRGIQGAERPDGAAHCGRIVGEYIKNNWPNGSLVALNSAGATPYYAPNIRFLDMLGLNDTAIAYRQNTPMLLPYQIVPGHAKGDGQYVFDRKPDYIIAGPSNGSDIFHAHTLSEYELSRIYDFKSMYRLKTILIPVSKYARHKEYTETESGEMKFTYYERVR